MKAFFSSITLFLLIAFFGSTKSQASLLSCTSLLSSGSGQILTVDRALRFYKRAWSLVQEEESFNSFEYTKLINSVMSSIRTKSRENGKTLEILFLRSGPAKSLIELHPSHNDFFGQFYGKISESFSDQQKIQLADKLTQWVFSQFQENETQKETGVVQREESKRLEDVFVDLEVKDWIIHSVISPDGKRVVTFHQKAAVLWDAEIGQRIQQLPDALDYQFHDLLPELIGVRGDGKMITLDAQTGEEKQSVDLVGFGGEAGISSYRFYPQASTLVTSKVMMNSETLAVEESPELEIWDAKTGIKLGEIPRRVGSLGFRFDLSSDGASVLVIENKVATLWNTSSRTKVLDLGRVESAEFSPDGKKLALGKEDGAFELIDLQTHKREALQGGFEHSPVGSISFSLDGRWISAVSAVTYANLRSPGNQGLAVWDLKTKERVQHWKSEKEATGVLFFPNKAIVIQGFDDEKLRAYDIATGRTIMTPFGVPTRSVLSVKFSKDGSRLLVQNWNAVFPRVWNLEMLFSEGLL